MSEIKDSSAERKRKLELMRTMTLGEFLNRPLREEDMSCELSMEFGCSLAERLETSYSDILRRRKTRSELVCIRLILEY